MDVAIVGAGYVGLVTAACLAEMGNRVRCLDIDETRIERLRRGIVPFTEPDLERLVQLELGSGRLTFHTDRAALRDARLAIVCIGTLDPKGDWTAAYVRAAVMELAADPKSPRWIVLRSTLLPGTALALAAEARHIDPRVRLAVNPEFTREGSAVSDFRRPHRVVVGVDLPGRSAVGRGDSSRAEATVEAQLVGALACLYEPLQAPFLTTDLTSAETIKIASNVYLAAKITFANEIARVAVATGADPIAVMDGLGLDERIGRAFLSPGPGYGGSCLPSQVRALPEVARGVGVQTRMIDAIARSNDEQADWLIEQAQTAHGGPLRGARVALLGLTFKAGTDDLRESPALRLGVGLVRRGARVVAYDPIATHAGVEELNGTDRAIVTAAATAEAACAGADLVIVATEWPQFRTLDWTLIGPSMRGRILVDARAIVDLVAAERAGMVVVGLRAPKTFMPGQVAPVSAVVGRARNSQSHVQVPWPAEPLPSLSR